MYKGSRINKASHFLPGILGSGRHWSMTACLLESDRQPGILYPARLSSGEVEKRHFYACMYSPNALFPKKQLENII